MRANPIRFTGMASGMDTDSIVKDLMRPQQYKIDNKKKEQALLKLKEDAWKDMNAKLYNFHTKFTHKLSTGTGVDKRITTSSNTSAIEINNGTTIPEGTHEIRIDQLATSTSVSGEIVDKNGDKNVTSKTTVKDLTGSSADKIQLTMRVNDKVDDEEGAVFTTVEIDKGDNLNAVAKKMNEALNKDGFTARYDEANGMFFVNSTKTGKNQSINFVSAFEMKTEEVIVDGVKYTPTTVPSGFFHNVGLVPSGFVGLVSGEIVDKNVTSKTTVRDLTGSSADKIQLTMRVNDKVDDEEGAVFTTVEIDEGDNLNAVAKKMNEALDKDGFTARYDEANGMFFVNSTKTGKNQSINFVSAFEMKTEEVIVDGVATPKYTPTTVPSGFFHNVGIGSNKKEQLGLEARYHYNGREMKSESNQIEVNGIKATLKAQDINETITISSVRDSDATYDFVKEFVTEYNTLIDEINTKIGTKPGRDIMPLTAEERDSMSDSEIKLWEDKLNSSLFYKDTQLTDFVDSARKILGDVFEGQTLASIGIVTGSWQEKGKLYILGDEDSGTYSTETNKLKAKLEENSGDVVKLLRGLGSKLYETHNKTMLSNNKLKSAMKFYNDKGMTEESKAFDKQIATMEERMYKMEDIQYRKFAAMEKMLSSLNNQSSWLSQQFGGM